ncbi:MAG TPA: ROK family transcriptional regulator, partial [Solirubrobacteraceae bacterium]|nr:ROK family transcriptional regulator [Solirubrobacteraceae bacterium]
GLSRSTVSTLVSELQASGLVVDPEPPDDGRAPQQGRPPTLLTLDRSAGLVLGIDFGHDQVHVAIADLSRTILAERTQPLDVDNSAASALDVAVALADEVIGAAGVDGDRILGAGAGLSGPIDVAAGTVHTGKILPGWVGVRPAEELAARLGVHVHLDNDANLGALAEVTLGAGIGARDAIYVMVSGGVGAGLILGGELYRGTGGTAGELGHVLVDESGPICRCGNRGCLEMMAGGRAIIALLRSSHGDDLTLDEVMALAADGDSGARRAIADAGRILGRSVAAIVNAFNPELVSVGGAVSAAGDVLLDPLQEAVHRYAIPSAAADVRITRGVLGDRAEVLGALELAARQSDVAAPSASGPVPPGSSNQKRGKAHR